MRVLHMGSGNMYGGIESMLVALAAARDAAPAMQPAFALFFEGRVANALRATGAPVRILGAVRASRPLSVWRARAALRRALVADAPDVVVTHGPWVHAMAGPVVRAAGVRCAFFAHGPFAGRHWIERLARRVPPDLVIANSRWVASSLAAFTPTAARVVHPPVDIRRFAQVRAQRSHARAELGIHSHERLVVMVSRLERWKGHEPLLDALATLDAQIPWRCVIAGGAQTPDEGAYEAALHARVAAAGLRERVTFLGQCDDVPRLLGAADVYCQPNLEPEPFGVSFVEALAAGLPVVSSDAGGVTEIVDASCGMLLPPGDVAALAATLGRLCADDALRDRLGAAAPARAHAVASAEVVLPALASALEAPVRAHARAAASLHPV